MESTCSISIFFLPFYSWYILRDAMVEWSVYAQMFAALSLTLLNDRKILIVHLYLINFRES